VPRGCAFFRAVSVFYLKYLEIENLAGRLDKLQTLSRYKKSGGETERILPHDMTDSGIDKVNAVDRMFHQIQDDLNRFGAIFSSPDWTGADVDYGWPD
jgi:hypothetical protein